jgi:thiol-disulfide isomerase/thioredoxin
MKALSTLGLVLVAAFALATPKSASEVLKEARMKAGKEKKNVLVIFHASWCGWCKRFDKFLETSEEGKLVASGLEIVHLTVLETAKMKAEETPGGFEYLKELGGDKAGLPYMAIIDAKTGKPIVDSLQKKGEQNSNTGYPGSTEEIGHFIKMLKAGAPMIDGKKRDMIQAWLTTNAPK